MEGITYSKLRKSANLSPAKIQEYAEGLYALTLYGGKETQFLPEKNLKAFCKRAGCEDKIPAIMDEITDIELAPIYLRLEAIMVENGELKEALESTRTKLSELESTNTENNSLEKELESTRTKLSEVEQERAELESKLHKTENYLKAERSNVKAARQRTGLLKTLSQYISEGKLMQIFQGSNFAVAMTLLVQLFQGPLTGLSAVYGVNYASGDGGGVGDVDGIVFAICLLGGFILEIATFVAIVNGRKIAAGLSALVTVIVSGFVFGWSELVALYFQEGALTPAQSVHLVTFFSISVLIAVLMIVFASLAASATPALKKIMNLSPTLVTRLNKSIELNNIEQVPDKFWTACLVLSNNMDKLDLPDYNLNQTNTKLVHKITNLFGTS